MDPHLHTGTRVVEDGGLEPDSLTRAWVILTQMSLGQKPGESVTEVGRGSVLMVITDA